MNKWKIEDAVEVLKFYDAQPYFFSGDAPAMNAFKMAISALEQQLADAWIPVTDGLPSKDCIYKVIIFDDWTKNCFETELNYINTIGFVCADDNYVIAWKPLPQPYK